LATDTEDEEEVEDGTGGVVAVDEDVEEEEGKLRGAKALKPNEG
jgi:hypothetical protein